MVAGVRCSGLIKIIETEIKRCLKVNLKHRIENVGYAGLARYFLKTFKN